MGSVSLKFFRLEPIEHPLAADAFSGKGGLYTAGRWNSGGAPVVYAADSIPLAYLEVLAHLAGRPEFERWLFEIDIPDHLIETRPASSLPDGWYFRPAGPASQSIGDRWLKEQRSVALRVPSVIVRQNWNVLINPQHPEFSLKWVKGSIIFKHVPRIVESSKLSSPARRPSGQSRKKKKR